MDGKFIRKTIIKRKKYEKNFGFGGIGRVGWLLGLL